MIFRSAALLLAVASSACAQPAVADRVLEDAPWCNEIYRNGHDREVVCEVRETVLEADRLDVSGAVNGPIKVKEWDRSDVLVRARVVGIASSQDRAAQLVQASHVDTRNGIVRSTTPETGGRSGDGVFISYEIFAPPDTNLDLEAVNGPVAIHGLSGQIRANVVNGPVSLHGVNGDVHIHALNGPVNVGLEGDHWRGAGLEVRAENGPIIVDVPGGYSARFSAETTNGRITTGAVQVHDSVRH